MLLPRQTEPRYAGRHAREITRLVKNLAGLDLSAPIFVNPVCSSRYELRLRGLAPPARGTICKALKIANPNPARKIGVLQGQRRYRHRPAQPAPLSSEVPLESQAGKMHACHSWRELPSIVAPEANSTTVGVDPHLKQNKMQPAKISVLA